MGLTKLGINTLGPSSPNSPVPLITGGNNATTTFDGPVTSNAFTFGGLSGSGNLAVKSPNLGYNAGAMGTYSLHQAEPNMGALEAYREAEGKQALDQGQFRAKRGSNTPYSVMGPPAAAAAPSAGERFRIEASAAGSPTASTTTGTSDHDLGLKAEMSAADAPPTAPTQVLPAPVRPSGLASLDFALPERGQVVQFVTPRGDIAITARAVSGELMARLFQLAVALAAILVIVYFCLLIARGRLARLGGPRLAMLLVVLGVVSLLSGVLPIAGLLLIIAGLVMRLRHVRHEPVATPAEAS